MCVCVQCECVWVCAHMHIQSCVCTSACVCMYVCVCAHVRKCVCVHVSSTWSVFRSMSNSIPRSNHLSRASLVSLTTSLWVRSPIAGSMNNTYVHYYVDST